MIAVGSKLLMKFKPPFDTRYQGDKIYLVTSVEEYSSYRAVGEMSEVYTGVTSWEAQVKTDESNGMKIACLVSEAGERIYIPTGYFWPTEGFGVVPWVEHTMIVSLNAWPRTHDHSDLRDTIESTIVNMVGVTPNIKLVETSRPTNFSTDDSDVMLATRVTRQDSMYDSAYALRKRLSRCMVQGQALEEYIANCLP